MRRQGKCGADGEGRIDGERQWRIRSSSCWDKETLRRVMASQRMIINRIMAIKLTDAVVFPPGGVDVGEHRLHFRCDRDNTHRIIMM